VLVALDVPGEWLPPVLESPEVSGHAPGGIAVAAGAGDCAAAALGVGIDRPGPLSVVLGTSGVVFAVLPEYQPEPEARVHVFCHAVPGAWHAMGVMLSAAGSLQWFRDRLAPEASFDELVAEAEAWDTGADGLVFLPYLAGERTPHADPGARGAFVGLSLHHDRGALVRAVLEGVAFGLRDSLELLRKLGVEGNVARISGGGSRGDAWLRIVSSVLGIPLETTASADGSAYGAALLGGVAGCVFPDVHDAVATCVRVAHRVEPDSAQVTSYATLHERYRALYPALHSKTEER
jgi:xylulokinase